jgi:hypothetical protein
MSDTTLTEPPPGSFWERSRQYSERFKWLIFAGVMIGLLILVTIRISNLINSQNAKSVPFDFAIVLAAMLSVLPALICCVQAVSRKRQLSKLTTLKSSPVAKTTAYNVAIDAIDPGRLVVDADYGIPIILFTFVCFVGFMTILSAYSHPELFSTPSVLLGGLKAHIPIQLRQAVQLPREGGGCDWRRPAWRRR